MNKKHSSTKTFSSAVAFIATCLLGSLATCQETFEFRGKVVDASDGKMIHARIYIENEAGKFFHVVSSDPKGNEVAYSVDRGPSKEIHTTVSNHVFKANLPNGKYTLTAEHGKEYLPGKVEFEIKSAPVQKAVKLKRWSNVANDGWYSGEVHIHRKVSEMPTVILAEDLNVVFPLTYWVTDSESTPVTHNKANVPLPKPELLKVTPQNVIWPVNTEYEIFSVNGKRHTLGAFFILGHNDPLKLKTPPVGHIAKEAHSQKALIDLDKHNWPWSMMLIPTMNVDLFELTNNHIWRTDFLFKDWYEEYAADYMNLEFDKDGKFTELGWIQFGLENYYTLLNCGFRISPSGGTASGVHPVPAGFGRVYVRTPNSRKNGFDYNDWLKGLEKGQSFVTTGPMMEFMVDGKDPGHVFKVDDANQKKARDISIKVGVPSHAKTRIELVANGKKIEPGKLTIAKKGASMIVTCDLKMNFDQSGWITARCFHELPNGRLVFAHSAPIYFEKANQPIVPRKAEVEYLIKRVSDEINRHQSVLTKEQLVEFHTALKFYQSKLKIAK